MNTPMFSKEQICKMFNCTPQQLQRQYAANAKGLQEMHDRAARTGKKVGGYTADQLKASVDQYNALAK